MSQILRLPQPFRRHESLRSGLIMQSVNNRMIIIALQTTGICDSVSLQYENSPSLHSSKTPVESLPRIQKISRSVDSEIPRNYYNRESSNRGGHSLPRVLVLPSSFGFLRCRENYRDMQTALQTVLSATFSVFFGSDKVFADFSSLREADGPRGCSVRNKAIVNTREIPVWLPSRKLAFHLMILPPETFCARFQYSKRFASLHCPRLSAEKKAM